MEDKKKVFKRRRWHKPFLENLPKFGTITAASTASGISRASVYRERAFTVFEELVQDAYLQHRDLLLLKMTNFAMKEGAASAPTAVQALQYLINRADKRLADADRAGGAEVPNDDTSITITVTESVAKRLFPRMLELHRADQNEPFGDITGPDDDEKKPN
jgi:hypothetical protein